MAYSALHNLGELQALGRAWRLQFSGVDFIGEIDLAEEEINILCRSLGRHLEGFRDEDFHSALAVAVVNLAYYLPEEGDDNSFRFNVLNALGARQDNEIWEEQIGSPILRLLVKYFSEENAPGPWRYVRPIMRQAGVPARSINQFAKFLCTVFERYGQVFSEREYQEALEKFPVQSKTLRSFLESRPAWAFCRDIGRILGNRRDGILSVGPGALPGFRSNILDALWSAYSDRLRSFSLTKRADSFPLPKFMLDLDQLCLSIGFHEKGLNGGYRWSDGRRVLSSSYMLKGEEFSGDISGYIKQPSGSIEPWKVTPWNPTAQPWAVFTPSGTFIKSSGALRPGRYVLAIPKSSPIPGRIYFDRGELQWRYSDSVFAVIDCELDPGFRVDEIGLFVESGNRLAPSLRFGEGNRLSRYTHNVFIGKLPEIEIINWTPSLANQFIITVESDRGRTALSEHLYRDKAFFRLDSIGPTRGNIRIEPKGRTPRGFVPSVLDYTLLPRADLIWPEDLHEADEQTTIVFSPGDQLAVQWDQKDIQRVAPGRWRVPAHLDFAEGLATYDDKVRFSVSGPISRIRFEGACIQHNLLWRDAIPERSDVRILVSRAEVGKSIDIGLLSDGAFIHMAQTPPVRGNCEIRLGTDDIRDVLTRPGLPVGVLALRGRGMRTVRSKVVCLSEKQVIDDLQSPEPNPSWLDLLPDGFRLVIKEVRQLHHQKGRTALPDGLDLPHSLRGVLAEYVVSNRILDWEDGIEYLSRLGSGPLRDLLGWYLEATQLLHSGQLIPEIAEQLLNCHPGDVSALRIQRWQTLIQETESALSDIVRFPGSIKEWNALCKAEEWGRAKLTGIGQMRGGERLTEAATDYYYAMERHENHRDSEAMNWFVGSNLMLASLREQFGRGIIVEVASVLQALICYHVRGGSSEEFREQVKTVVEGLGSQWAAVKSTLMTLSDASVGKVHAEPVLTLSDVSPHPSDGKLEDSINGR